MSRPAPPETDQRYVYHALQIARRRFGRDLAELDDDQLSEVYGGARDSYQLESRVLDSAEARSVELAEARLDESLATIRGRYDDAGDYHADLERNGLDERALRDSLRRELVFDSVMQAVSGAAPAVTEADLRLFYELHRDRFQTPEVRRACHILITVNAQFAENTPVQARRRIDRLAKQAQASPSRFESLARRYSECPTATDGGRLGEVARGQLYPSLDQVLFSIPAGAVSDVVESEMGLHLLYCEQIRQRRQISFRNAQDRVRLLVEQRTRRTHLKAWVASLTVDPASTDSLTDLQAIRPHG